MSEAAGHSRSESASGLELLVHYELVSDASAEPRRGFAVLLELSPQQLLLETDTPLETGDNLLLNFFLSRTGARRVQVSLACEISECRDAKSLRYSAQVSNLEGGSEGAVRSFVEERARRTSR